MGELAWESVAKEAQDHRHASISRVRPALGNIKVPKESLNYSGLPKRLLSKQELEITDAPPEHLISVLATKRHSAVEVATAFLRRAVIAQSAVLDDFFFPNRKADIPRPIALPSSFLSEPSNVPSILTLTFWRMERLKGLCMDSLSVSRSTLE